MNRFTLLACLALATMAPPSVSAEENASITGVVTEVMTYTDANIVLFRLSNQPTAHPNCSPAYFELLNVPEPMFARVYARLLTAKATGEPVSIGYDNVASPCRAYIPVHRVG